MVLGDGHQDEVYQCRCPRSSQLLLERPWKLCFINEEIKARAKKFKVRMFYHLQNLFWGVFVRGFCVGGICPGGFVLIPSSIKYNHNIIIIVIIIERTATSLVVPLTANIFLRAHWRAFDTACF